MTTKLHINISQGVIDIEGDPDLVREIYNDFKEHLQSAAKESKDDADTSQPPAPNGTNGDPGEPQPKSTSAKTRRRTATRRKPNSNHDTTDPTMTPKVPRLDKNLDTAELPEFYKQFEPKNNSEKILIFLKFLTDELQIESPNTDQIFTCFDAVNEKVPEAFAQAFINTSGKFGYIDYNSATDIKISTKGINHFKHTIKRKEAE